MDQEQRNTLLDILINKISPSQLKYYIYKLLGPGEFDRLQGHTHAERCIRFIEELYRTDKEDELLEVIAEYRPDIDLFPFDIDPYHTSPGIEEPRQISEEKMDESPITWLHLSDFHFRTSESYDSNIVLNALLRDISDCIRNEHLQPDFIIVSGDIAFSGRAEEYALAQQFLDRLLETTHLSKRRLFLVPGNHDVDGDAISPLAAGTTAILNNRVAVNSFLADDTCRDLMFKRFRGYQYFISRYLGEHIPFDSESYFYAKIIELRNLQVAVLGLNSAWLYASNKDRGQLLLGEQQVRTALDATGNADLRLAVMHHPFDWLQKSDRAHAERLLRGECDFILHGHMHQTSLLQTRTPHYESMIIAAGACYETRQYPNSYNFVQLDLSVCEGKGYFRTYINQRGGFWTKDVLNYQKVDDGVYTFALPAHLCLTKIEYGPQYQNTYTVSRMLEMLDEGSQAQTVFVEGKGNRVEDLTILHADGTEEVVQVKARREVGAPWRMRDLEPAIAAMYQLSGTGRNIKQFRLVAAGAAHPRVTAIKESCQRLREGNFEPDRDAGAVSDVCDMIDASEKSGREFMRRLWLDVPMANQERLERMVKTRLVKDYDVLSDNAGRVYEALMEKVAERAKLRDTEARAITREHVSNWLRTGIDSPRGLLASVLTSSQQRVLEDVHAAAEKIWSRPLRRYYTDHTIAHCERVIALLDALTADMMATKKRLSSTEVLVLLSAAYLHDIGMQSERSARGNLEEICAAHHEQTAEMICTVFEEVANAHAVYLAEDTEFVRAVGLVARGHEGVDLFAAEYDPLVYSGDTIRLRLLTALLRFADELDMDHRRVNLEQLKQTNLSLDVQLQWWKYYYISSLDVVDSRIQIAYRFPQNRSEYQNLIAPLVESEIQEELTDLEEIFAANNVEIALGEPRVHLVATVQRLPPEMEVLARQEAGIENVEQPLDYLQLQDHLWAAMDILRDKGVGTTNCLEYVSALIFLKRASDIFQERYEEIIRRQVEEHGRTEDEARKRTERRVNYADSFYVPVYARWSYLRDELYRNVGNGLNKALAGMEEENRALEGVFTHIDFTCQAGDRSLLDDRTIRQIIQHFSKIQLRDETFESSEAIGAAYEQLIRRGVDPARKASGEFRTPRSVGQLMVRLLNPQPGMRIYDPCVGSGSLLLLSREHVAETGGDPDDLALYGQEINREAWAICKMSLLLHGVRDADIRHGDTLLNPLHLDPNGELMCFDRVISNPPFSQRYSKDGIRFKERLRRGYTPRRQADFMFLQHMLAVLKPDGMMATVMPPGALFRGGAEQEIRESILEEDLLEAVIGLPPNLFYGTGISTCILVLRSLRAKPPDRQGKVLFIDACVNGQAGHPQGFLQPQQIDKIASTFDAFQDVPGYARVVDLEDLRSNEYKLDIDRYIVGDPSLKEQAVFLTASHSARAGALVGDTVRLSIRLTSGYPGRFAILIEPGQDEISLFIQAEGFYIQEGDSMVNLSLPSKKAGLVFPTSFPIMFEGDKDSDQIGAVVELQARLPGAHQITIEPLYGGRRYDPLSIPISVRSGEKIERPELPSPMKPRPGHHPDLITRVYATPLDESGHAYRLRYVAFSPISHLRLPGVPIGSIDISAAVLAQVREELSQLVYRMSNITPTICRARLAALGKRLYRIVFPQEMRDLYHELTDANIESWLILSERAPWVPWELIKPFDSSKEEDFLGSRFAITRFIEGLGTPRQYEFPLGRVSLTLDDQLRQQLQPQEWEDLFPPGAVPWLRSSLMQEYAGGYISAMEYNSPIWGLHFAGVPGSLAHRGGALVTCDSRQAISEEAVRDAMLDFWSKRPLVTFGMVGVEGRSALTEMERQWVPTFVKAGIASFVGTLWVTKPQADRLFWSTFYRAIWSRKPLGKAALIARRAVRSALPNSMDWLAYFTVGDPMARGYRPKLGEGYASLNCLSHDLKQPMRVGETYSFYASLGQPPPTEYHGRRYRTEDFAIIQEPHVMIFAPEFEVGPGKRMPLVHRGDRLGQNFHLRPHRAGRHDLFVKFFDGEELLQTIDFTVEVKGS